MIAIIVIAVASLVAFVLAFAALRYAERAETRRIIAEPKKATK